MPTINILTENSLGFSHSGEVIAYGEGVIELTDEQVQQLVSLIRENNGETDVKKLQLEEKFPEIYEILEEAFREVARNAEYNHWVIEGYENGWYDVDTEEMITKCEEKYGFKFEYDTEDYLDDDGNIDEDMLYDAKADAFFEWVEEHRIGLSEDDEVAFLSDVFGLEPDVDDVYYEVEIPADIVKMALPEP